MSKDPNGPPPAYQNQKMEPGMPPVYTYPSEGPQQVMYAGQPVYPNQTGGYITQQPGQVTVLMSPPLQNPPPDNLIYAIFVTICCCWPIGIFAILRAVATRDAINRGDGQTAAEMSKSGRCLSHAALACGIAMMVILVVFFILYFVVLIPGLAASFSRGY